MKTVCQITAAIAMLAFALPFAQAAKAPSLRFELADGTVISGTPDVNVIGIRIASDNVLKIPVAELAELNVGLNNLGELVKRTKTLLKALDSNKTRQEAERELIAMGPAIMLIVSGHAPSDVPAQRAAITRVLNFHKSRAGDQGPAPDPATRPIKLRSTIQADVNTFVGRITVKQFNISTPYGQVAVKLEDIRRIRQSPKDASAKIDKWSITLRDKTDLKGVVLNPTIRVKTPYGIILVPPADILKATLADDAKTVVLQTRTSARIVGVIDPKTTISLKIDTGKKDIPAAKIASLAAHGLLVLDLGQSVTLKLVLVPSGKFLMGSSASEPGRRGNEGPQRWVTISKSFYMGATEVTQAQYQILMHRNPSRFKGAANPVEQASWKDATVFCKILSKKTGRQVALPTEAQWEYASRAGANTSFSFGDDFKKLDAYGWFSTNSGGKHHPVGTKKPNPFGLYDMNGNVWEWCRDWHDDTAYAKAKNVDPENTKASKYRIQRGGSWRNNASSCRSAMRGRSAGGDRNYDFGFRVVIPSDSTDD
ncbi:MAG: formylglycine-generating enzyme family protein [Phycisphaerales bacterium]|jgi:formylglycine-generating enzyme required for sulfatase activity|nr:formylglycine-generating enzyme family protein [Phycisphaerales bacterium]